MARDGRPAAIAWEQRFTAVDPSANRESLPAGHDVTWPMLVALTPSILPAPRPSYEATVSRRAA